MLSSRKKIHAIRTSFRNLATSFARLGPALAYQAETNSPRTTKGTGRKKPRLTSKRRAELKLQGKYLGTMRGLSAAKRAKVKKIHTEKGIRAAIALAKTLTA